MPQVSRDPVPAISSTRCGDVAKSFRVITGYHPVGQRDTPFYVIVD
jgi:hypothetical protein